MPSESFKRLQQGIEAWNRGDIDAAVENLHEDIVWRTGGQFPDVEAVYEGREGVRRFFREFSEPWDEVTAEIEEVIEDREDQVVVLVNFHARGREGIELDGRFIHIWRSDEQRLVREFRAYPEEDRARDLREAGLDE